MSTAPASQEFGIGVGGVVVRDNRLLMVKHNYGPRRWQIPGGSVQRDETLQQAVCREVREETAITPVPEGIFAVRQRINDKGNNLYVVFKCHTDDTRDPVPDGKEVSDARFFTVEDIDSLTESWNLNGSLARAVLLNEPHLFVDRGDPENLDRQYTIFF